MIRFFYTVRCGKAYGTSFESSWDAWKKAFGEKANVSCDKITVGYMQYDGTSLLRSNSINSTVIGYMQRSYI